MPLRKLPFCSNTSLFNETLKAICIGSPFAYWQLNAIYLFTLFFFEEKYLSILLSFWLKKKKFNEFLVYSKGKRRKMRNSQGSFSYPISHSCLVMGWIGMGKYRQNFELYKKVALFWSVWKKMNTKAFLKVCITYVVMKFFPSKWLQMICGG